MDLRKVHAVACEYRMYNKGGWVKTVEGPTELYDQ